MQEMKISKMLTYLEEGLNEVELFAKALAKRQTNQVDITLIYYSVVWLFFSAVWSKVRPSSFLFIRASGFGLIDQFVT